MDGESFLFNGEVTVEILKKYSKYVDYAVLPATIDDDQRFNLTALALGDAFPATLNDYLMRGLVHI